jgi:Methyltransferase domain
MANGLSRIPGVSRLDRYLREHYTGRQQREFAPHGSFYSPFPDRKDVERRGAKLFAKQGVELGPSIDLRTNEQAALLKKLAVYYTQFDWPKQPTASRRFYLDNDFFLIADALTLYGLIRHFHPRRIVAIGGEFAAALMLDTNERFLDNAVNFTFVEPDPQRLEPILTSEDMARLTVLDCEVQDLPITVFDKLERGDFLFIDSSHVAKFGSDVTHLMFEVLPRLASGVIVQFHDIMWPFEYPRPWIVEGRAWNEAYLVRAFLQYNDAFQILLFNNYAGYCLTQLVKELMPRFLENKGGSLWLQKAA